MSRSESWHKVSKAEPCPACLHADWCAWTPDGAMLKCERTTEVPAGMALVKSKDGGALFRFESVDAHHGPTHSSPAVKLDLNRVQQLLVGDLASARLDTLANELSVTTESLRALGIGWANPEQLRMLKASGKRWYPDYPAGAYSFPERDGNGRIVGFSLRAVDGRKGAPSSEIGCARGLVFSLATSNAQELHEIVEGASDAAACLSMGLIPIARPSNSSGAEQVAHLTRGRRILVVGENDEKPDGDWPGRTGAMKVASKIAQLSETSVRWTLPRHGVKDVRQYLEKAVRAGLDLTDTAALHQLGRTVLTELNLNAKTVRASSVTNRPFPAPLGSAARIGLAGRFVRALEPFTEADATALLTQFLVMFGNVIGRTAHYLVEATPHYMNLDLVLTGDTSKGRKGTSLGRVQSLFARAAPEWVKCCIVKGLSSGEGLIYQVRDPGPERDDNNCGDLGAGDKRAMVVEPEFASVLKVARRDGNTLSTVIRDAWDTGFLKLLTKNSPHTATDAHISIIGHITGTELYREWSEIDTANGFGNRVLWIHSQRARLLPDGAKVPEDIMQSLTSELSVALQFASATGEMQRDEQARALWGEIYTELARGGTGTVGAMTARAEAQILRISCIYALLDKSDVVRAEHLRAAKAITDFVERTVRFVFGDSVGDPIADELLGMLRDAPDGMTRTDIRDAFQRNSSKDKVGNALQRLSLAGLAFSMKENTDGRPAERWFAGASLPSPNDAESTESTTKTTETTKGDDAGGEVSELRSSSSSMSYDSEPAIDADRSSTAVTSTVPTTTTEMSAGLTSICGGSDLRSFPSSMSFGAESTDGAVEAKTPPPSATTTETTETTKGFRSIPVPQVEATTKTTETTRGELALARDDRRATTKTTETTEVRRARQTSFFGETEGDH